MGLCPGDALGSPARGPVARVLCRFWGPTSSWLRFPQGHSALNSEHLRLQLSKPVADRLGTGNNLFLDLGPVFSCLQRQARPSVRLETAFSSVFSLRLTLLEFKYGIHKFY